LPLLISFVQTTLLARKAARDPEGIGAWEKAVRSQCQLARALRLTVQSRADPKTIGRRMPEQRQSAYDTGWEDLDA
jgi:plasmid stabilization system protein ParE